MSNQPPSSNSQVAQVITLLLAAVSVPTAVGAVLLDFWKRQPAACTGSAALWAVVVIVFGVVSGVWQHQQGRLVDGINKRIDRFAPRYRARYLEYLVNRHRNFDVKGLTTQGIYTLELQRVFVELSIAPQTLDKASVEIAHMSRETQRASAQFGNTSRTISSATLPSLAPQAAARPRC